MRIGLLFRALGRGVAVLANVDPLTELNNLRAANGIPAGIAENPAWSAGCAQHMHYLELNGFEGDWHTEVPGRARATPTPARPPPGSSVLSNAPSLGLEPDWETSPFHFAQLLAPKLSVSGYARRLHLHLARLQAARAAGAARSTRYPGDGVPARRARTCTSFGFGGGIGERHAERRVADRPDGPVAVQRRSTTTPPGAAGLPPAGRDPRPRRAARGRRASTPPQVTFTSDEGLQRDASAGASAPASSAPRRGAGRRGRPARLDAPPRRCRAAARRG